MSDPHTVLIVEDEPEIAVVVALRLRLAGFRTLAAECGQAALDLAREHIPDAIVLDVRMPGMDGLTALKHLKSGVETRDIPVVMLSASLVDKPATLEYGARYFLTKPYDAPTLVTAVKSAISESDQQPVRGSSPRDCRIQV